MHDECFRKLKICSKVEKQNNILLFVLEKLKQVVIWRGEL